MSAQLKNRGYHVGRRKARRYMNEMDIYPIYPNPVLYALKDFLIKRLGSLLEHTT